MGRYTCSKCKNEYDSSEIRLRPNSRIVCVYCLGQKTVPLEQSDLPGRSVDMVEYVCKTCKYKFKRRKNSQMKSCPYCGRFGTLMLKETADADSLIEQSMAKEFDK